MTSLIGLPPSGSNFDWLPDSSQSQRQFASTLGSAPGVIPEEFRMQPWEVGYQGETDRRLDAHYGQDISRRGGDYTYANDMWGGRGPSFSGSGGGGGASSIGGVSAVNPQAGQANELDAFKRYEDAAYGNAMSRLEPQLRAADRDFDQEMANRGIPVGSEAYNLAKTQFEQNRSGALNDTAFGAMQFGLGAQNQSFQQDLSRSQLANALLQAQWQKEIGLGNIGLGHARLGEQSRQFDEGLGYDYDTFYDTLGQRAYEFDAGQDFDYWNRGNVMDLAWNRAASDDYFGAYDRDFQQEAYYNDLLLSLFGPAPGVTPGNPYSAYGTQIGGANAAQGNLMDFWGDLFSSSTSFMNPGG